MSAFVIKIIAVTSMIIDHLGILFWGTGLFSGDVIVIMRSIGRLAFPLFCFMIINGFEKTSNRKKYLSRLVLFAIISQVPFSLFSMFQYMPPRSGIYLVPKILFPIEGPMGLVLFVGSLGFVCFACLRLLGKNISILYVAIAFVLSNTCIVVGNITILTAEHLNVFYTLAIGLACIILIDRLARRRGSLAENIIFLIALAICIVFCAGTMDYGIEGICLIILIYCTSHNKILRICAITLWALWNMGIDKFIYVSAIILSLVPMLLYNGNQGKKTKWLFYLIYPAHLALFCLIGFSLV